jgi:hypothetical protein
LWQRKGAKQQLHATITFRLSPNAAIEAELLDFLRATCLRLEADFAYLHNVTSAELELGKANKTVGRLDNWGKKLNVRVVSKDFQLRLPELYWATFFGARYTEMFGLDRVLSTPAFAVEALPDQAVLLQLTENLTDVAEHPDVFNDIRTQAKVHLGKEAFFQPELGEDHKYLTPHFEFA